MQILENYKGKLQNLILLCLFVKKCHMFVIWDVAMNVIDSIIYKDTRGKSINVFRLPLN